MRRRTTASRIPSRSVLLGLWLAAVMALIVPAPAHAQAPRAPLSDGADRAGLSASPTIDRDRSDRATPVLPGAPRVSLPTPAASVAPAGNASAAAIALTKVRFVGTSLAPALLDNAVAPHIGRPLNIDNLQAIATAVGKAYARSDIAYYAVSIPAQTPTGGVLTLQVVEGFVRNYTLAGTTPSTPVKLIEAHVRRLMGGGPLLKSKLERALSLMRDIPGQTVAAQVRQLDQQGALMLDLSVKRKQIELALTIDNNGVANVVRGIELQAAVTVNGMLREGDSTRVSGYLPLHPSRYQFYSVSHSTPIGSNGMVATVNAAHVETTSRDSQIKGNATLAGISISYPLIRSYKTNLSISASLDGVNSSNYFLDTQFGDYRSRAARLGFSWSKADEKKGYALSAVVSHGLDIFDAKVFAGFSEKSFDKVNLQSVAVRSLTKKLMFTLKVNGQYTRDMLPVTERLSLGGAGAGRAFRTGTLTAERGVTGVAELAWSPPLKSPLLKGSSLFVFTDGAAAHSVARPVYALPAQNYSLVSAGGGIRLSLAGKWDASFEAAVPLKRPSSNYSRSTRFFFGIGRRF